MPEDPGRYIAQGVWGCAFRPAIECEGQVFPKATVGKVLKYNFALKEEIESAKFIEEIDPDHTFTVGMVAKCKVHSTAIKLRSGAKNCRRFLGTGLPSGMYHQLVYQDGGDSLECLIRNKMKLRDVADIAKASSRVFEGLDRMGGLNLCHADIHPGNLLWDGKRLKLIDFDWSREADTIYTDGRNAMRRKIGKASRSLSGLLPFESYFFIDPRVSASSMRSKSDFPFTFQNYEEIDTFLRELKTVSLPPLSSYGRGFDIFCLGASLLRVLFAVDASERRSSKFKTLENTIRWITNMNPHARPTALQVAHRLRKMT